MNTDSNSDPGFPMARILAVGLVLAIASPAVAHSPIMVCYDNGDKTVTCEAGFTDGSTAVGAGILVTTIEERVLEKGSVGADGTFTFTRPEVDEIEIHFTSDSAHSFVVYNDEIVPLED